MSRWAYAPLHTWAEYYTYQTANCQDHINGGRDRGIDWGRPTGYKIPCSYPGTVVKAGWDTRGYGNLVVVKHANGFYTWYGHMSAFLVSVGQHVEIGTPLGKVGSTGNSTGPHIHHGISTEKTYGWVCPEPYYVQGTSAGEYKPVSDLYIPLDKLLTIDKLGLDVSVWQKGFDYQAAKRKAPNLEFVIARATYGNEPDETFD